MDDITKDPIKWVTEKIKKLNFKDPVILILTCLVLVLPFAAGYLFKMGLALGLMQTLGILLVYRKFPQSLKQWCEDHPLVSDIALDAISTATMAGLFGGGVTLAISAIVTGLVLSWAIPAIEKLEHEQRKSTSSP